MSTVDGGRVRAPRPHAATAAEVLLSRILDEVEAVHDMLREVLAKPQPDEQSAQRVQEPAPVAPPVRRERRVNEQLRTKR